MHLVMFDIDGTLTETMKVDEECFVRSPPSHTIKSVITS
jgi:hypothetical protein